MIIFAFTEAHPITHGNFSTVIYCRWRRQEYRICTELKRIPETLSSTTYKTISPWWLLLLPSPTTPWEPRTIFRLLGGRERGSPAWLTLLTYIAQEFSALGGSSRTWTYNPAVNSRMLYLLSYGSNIYFIKITESKYHIHKSHEARALK